MATYNKMTESKFNAIKLLLNGGASYDECARYLHCSTGVVWRVKAAETWEEYLQANAARAIAEKKKKEQEQKGEQPVKEPAKQEEAAQPAAQPRQVVQTVTIQATHYMMEEMRKQNELLTLISNKLAYIVEQLA